MVAPLSTCHYCAALFDFVRSCSRTYASFRFVEQHKTGQPSSAAGAGAAAVGPIVPKSSKICDTKLMVHHWCETVIVRPCSVYVLSVRVITRCACAMRVARMCCQCLCNACLPVSVLPVMNTHTDVTHRSCHRVCDVVPCCCSLERPGVHRHTARHGVVQAWHMTWHRTRPGVIDTQQGMGLLKHDI